MEHELRHKHLAEFVFVGLAVALVLVTCAHKDTVPVGTTTTTGAELPAGAGEEAPPGHGADPRAIEVPALGEGAAEAENLAQALCERKLACDEIGPNRPHASMQACMNEARRTATVDVQSMGCPQGLAEPLLGNCLSAVRAQPCSADLDIVANVDACSQASLCAP
ncbi:hypothetical protein AKJ09_09483 [Labilithrix luteola]|uniref:Uncharacterized protein n=1 Tax=Labilithrix luteola TaxID=1391654 RepID=A0A0K1QBN5_9BACT|nr:DUF6184 family natural product biosynthesis lipoprotein [Labilithrix luteola]AKV02820.1 hypothetical protein AKJ09_09483 [Labilithrix luteola]